MTLHLRFSGINGLGSRFSSWPPWTLKLRATSALIRLPGQSPLGLTRRLCYSPYVWSLLTTPPIPLTANTKGAPHRPVRSQAQVPSQLSVTSPWKGDGCFVAGWLGWTPTWPLGMWRGQSHSPPVCEWLEQTCCRLKAFCPSSFCSRAPPAGDRRLLLEIYLGIYLSVGVSEAGFFSPNSGIMRQKESPSHSWSCSFLVLRFLALLSTFQSLLTFALQIKVQAFSFT